MSLYHVQKLLQSVNRDSASRDQYFKEKSALLDQFDLDEDERAAIMELSIGELYEMGVHPLLLRPFTIINGVSEEDYLAAIREGH